MSSTPQHNKPFSSDQQDIKREIFKYVKHWKWFVAGLVGFLLIAFVHLRYATPQYAAQATIKLLQDKGSSPVTTLLGDAGFTGVSDKIITDEVKIISSPTLISDVIRELNFNFQMFSEGRVTNKEIYPERPVKINFLVPDSTLYNSYLYFELSNFSKDSYTFTDANGSAATFRFGENVPLEIGSLVITPVAPAFDRYKDTKLLCMLRPVEDVAFSKLEQLSVSTSDDRMKRSNLINLAVTDAVPGKAQRFLEKLIELYNRNTIEQKGQVAKVTFQFINDRIDLISRDLADVDRTKERFKVGNQVTDIISEAGIYLQAGAQAEQELIQLETELNTVNYMIGYLQKQGDFELVPTNVGLNDTSLSSVTSQYNELVLERQRLLRSSGEKNPIVVQLDERLEGLRGSMRESLSNIRSALNIRSNNLQAQENLLDSRIAAVPGQERENRDIQRQQDIKEAIYLYLLQKREESAIAMATTTPNAEVVDRPRVDSKHPVSPKPKIIYLAASILGLALPFLLVYIKNLLDSKIHSRDDLLKHHISIPVLTEIPVSLTEKNGLEPGERSAMAEAFRTLRNSIDLECKSKAISSKVVFVTSSVTGEGKSFVAYNLAATYAFTNKKVLLLGSDIRKPNLNGFINGNDTRGLTDFLVGQEQPEALTKPVLTYSNFDVMQSGKVPANPNELLLSPRISELFTWARASYDVVIVDTAPCLLVSDTLLLAEQADISLYVIRAGYTEKETLNFVRELNDEQKLREMRLVLNAVKGGDLGYGRSYQYYYGDNAFGKHSFWQRLKRRLSQA